MPPRRRRADEDDAPGPSGRVSNVHRFALVQALMRAGFMREDQAQAIAARLTGNASDDLYRRMVGDQNREMAAFNLQIRTLKYPKDQQRYVGLINTHADEASKLGTRYTPQELQYFRTVMEAIAVDDAADGGVCAASSIELLNLEVRAPVAATQAGGASQAPAATQGAGSGKLSKAGKEAALRKLVADGWLAHAAGAGQYTLGVRTFLELGGQLLELDGLPDATRDAWQDLM